MEVSSFAEGLRVAARLLHIGFRRVPGPFLVLCVLPSKAEFSKVDPTRLELLTSAMRRQHHSVADVRKFLQISILFPKCCRLCSPLFVWIGVRLVSTVIRRFREPKCVFGHAQQRV